MFRLIPYRKPSASSKMRKNSLKKQHISRQHRLETGIVTKSELVAEVVRGVKQQDAPTVFHPQAWFGFSSRKAITQSSVVTVDEVISHKGSILTQDYYLSTTTDAEIAKKFGSLMILFDAQHPQQWIDVEATYVKEMWQHPENVEDEKITLAVLHATAKEFHYKESNVTKTLQNPFYLRIDQNNLSVVEQYHKTYVLYCRLNKKSNIYHPEYSELELNELIKEYVMEKIALYGLVLGAHSPFNLTPQQFAKRYPDYTRKLCQFAQDIPEFSHKVFFPSMRDKVGELTFFSYGSASQSMTMKELYLQSCVALYRQHPFTPKKPANTF